MAFRHISRHDEKRWWLRWVESNRGDLERLGLPLTVYESAAHWEDFLENGELHYRGHTDPGRFDFTDLAPGQQQALCAFLETHYGQEPPALLQWLRVRLHK